jgi:hypothetical protein
VRLLCPASQSLATIFAQATRIMQLNPPARLMRRIRAAYAATMLEQRVPITRRFIAFGGSGDYVMALGEPLMPCLRPAQAQEEPPR